jgi:prophage tail gpP-like protein
VSVLNIKEGDFISIPCFCKKSKENKDKDTIMLSGHDKNGYFLDCHNCFKHFDKVKELTTEAITEAIKIKQEETANAKKKKRNNEEGDNQDE